MEEGPAGPRVSPWRQMGGQVWRCAGCGEGLGVIVGQMLIVGVAVAIVGSVEMRCMVCGRHQVWHAGRRTTADERPQTTDERPPALKSVG